MVPPPLHPREDPGVVEAHEARAHVRLHTLGGLRVEANGEDLPDLPAQPVRAALLLYLALERRATRDQVIGLLWPDRDTERARHSLSQTLYELRRDLGAGWVEARGDALRVVSTVTVDALDFVAAVEDGRHGAALAPFPGAFLEGVHVGGTRPFQGWIDDWRSSLQRHLRFACREEAKAREAAGELAAALELARMWVRVDPLEDEAQHLQIRLLIEMEQRTDALLQYDEYEALLARELDVEPLDRTRELVARLRSSWDASPASRDSADPPSYAEAPTEGPAPGASSTGPVSSTPIPVGAPRAARPHRRLSGGALAVVVLAPVLIVGGLALGTRDTPGAPSASAPEDDPARRSGGVAVLPFLNLSPDPTQGYFADGITEDLIAHLSHIEGLRVISRTSVMRFRHSDLAVSEIARELGVAYLLEGSARLDEGRVRITVQLIDPKSDDHLWTETYDRELTDIFRIQSEIAERVAASLERRLSPGTRTRIAGGGTGRVDAYTLLLRGREYLNRPGEADVRKYPPAMAFFHQALELDPTYARALVELSRAFRENVGLPLTIRRDSALVYAEQALDADPELADGWATLGWAQLFGRSFQGAEEAFRRAGTLDPNLVDPMAGLARLHWIRGRLDEAIMWQRRAVAIDPSSARQLSLLGGFLQELGDLEGAAAAYRRAVDLAPDAPAPAFLLAQIRLVQGRDDEAEALIDGLLAASGDHPGTRFLVGRFEARRGRPRSAAEHLDRAAQALNDIETVLLNQAFVARSVGDEDRALELLARAESRLERREQEGFRAPRLRLQLQALRGDLEAALATLDGHWNAEMGGGLLAGPQLGVYWLDHDPLLGGLHGHPRFQELLDDKRIRLDSMRARAAGVPRGPGV